MLTKKYNFHLLLHSAALVEERLRVKLKPFGIGTKQARVLGALECMGEVSQVDLAREFELTAASMSTMTNRLLKAGLIERKVDEQELRRNILKLSSQGNSLLKAIYREWNEMDKLIVKTIGVENSKSLFDLSLKLRNGLGGFRPGEHSLDEKS